MLNNREVASLILLAALAVVVLAGSGRSGILKSVGGVARSFFSWKILAPLLFYGCTIWGAVVVARQLGLWETGLTKATISWAIFSGVGLLFGLDEALRDGGHFKRAFLAVVGVSAVLQFISALSSFPLWVEVPTQALAFLFAGVAVVAARAPDQKPAVTLANIYLGGLGLVAVIWSVVDISRRRSELDRGLLLREFLLPVWLTPVALAFLYFFAVIAAHEQAWTRMSFFDKEASLWRQRAVLVVRSNVRLKRLRKLSGYALQDLARAPGLKASWLEATKIFKN